MPSKRAQPFGEHPEPRGKMRGEDELLPLARRVTDVSGCPVVGGVAVMLHGGGQNTGDIDIYSTDFWATHQKLEAAGIMWDGKRREHLIDGVAVHMVKEDSLGGPPKKINTIRGVQVIGLADLIRGKLIIGLNKPRRATKDLAHVSHLIQRIPLGKDFAPKLPKELRAPFKTLVDQAFSEGPRRRSALPTLKLLGLA